MALAIECIYTTLTIKGGQQKIATESIWRVPQSSPLFLTSPDLEKVKTCKEIDIDNNIFVFHLNSLIGRFATNLQENLLFSRFVFGVNTERKAISNVFRLRSAYKSFQICAWPFPGNIALVTRFFQLSALQVDTWSQLPSKSIRTRCIVLEWMLSIARLDLVQRDPF